MVSYPGLAVKKVVAGHYKVTNQKGEKFWVARVENTATDGVWQVGVIALDGFEDPPFDAAPTMYGCLGYCLSEEESLNFHQGV